MTLTHETLVFERKFDVPPARLFQAYVNPAERQVWSAPDPKTVFVIETSDVRTGGQELARCGTKEALDWTMKVLYHWVEKDKKIIFTEELWQGDAVLTVALITFELKATEGGGTQLTLTDQITSFVESGGVNGHREGYEMSLNKLADLMKVA